MAIKFETATNLLALPELCHGFFKRDGGVSTGSLASLNCVVRLHETEAAVMENRRRVLSTLGIEDYVLAIPQLDHGNSSIIIDEKTIWDDVCHQKADAVITTQSNVALAITYADCLPILVSSHDGLVIAAIHAGWRGMASGVIGRTIERVREVYRARDLVAAVGPAISPRGFVVTDNVFTYFQQVWPDFVEGSGQRGNVDLTGIAERQLRDAGVLFIEKVGGYTDLDSDAYFSHRRECGETGRHIALVAKKRN